MRPIGGFQPENPFFLAPMEAVNCASFRLLCKRRGAALVYTDMIDADQFMALVEKEGEAAAVARFVNPQEDERPLAIQLGGPKLPALVETARILAPYAALFDLNIGCPLPSMLGKKGGVYLMKHPDQLYRLVKGLRAAIAKPLTVKIRSGWDDASVNAVEVAQELERLGVDAITIHPRTGKQGYRDRADWPLARRVKESIGIPLILSGDVTNAYMAHMAFAHVKCDYIMVARGAKANPSLFAELNGYWERREQPAKPEGLYVKSAAAAKRDFAEFLSLYKEREKRDSISEIRDHALWTSTGCQDAGRIKRMILEAKDGQELLTVFDRVRFSAQGSESLD